MSNLNLFGQINTTKKTNLLDKVFKLAIHEIDQITHNIQLKIEFTTQMPNIKSAGYFFKVDFPESNSIRYWIDWIEDLGAWIEADGKTATILVKESASIEQIEYSTVTCLASHIAATCLCLQGQIAIHANVIAINDLAVAFVGDSGKGKSTLTAYCASRGVGFVTDDVLVIDRQGFALPGSPRIKLFPSTADILGLDTSQETAYKIHYKPEFLGAKIQTQPLPLKCIYLLEESFEDIYSELLTSGLAMMELIKNSYHTSIIIKDNLQLFDDYINLIKTISVKKIFYPRNLDRLSEVYDFIVREVNQFNN
ncbi:hypothetical protein Sta7437_0995 [Stanieria cyanosphaera PCC 7437]|uniref:HPr kinase n=1 Tax=Stanieria cyanosphaera (strain ATCC 29371 / PCC 7437) TaxID=111780 RepID=K9XPP6_STAC7|nr:hypothetical protein [Stanieria cyanosphaera]AFZ34575.1 hypothetical protein Sta7437_0995 [Stanieria cyanosphaera PCC 7437]